MKVPNPFVLFLKALSWPFWELLKWLCARVWFQKWVLERFAASGLPQSFVNQVAATFNDVNQALGIPVVYAIAPADAVEKSQSEQAEKPSEAKP